MNSLPSSFELPIFYVEEKQRVDENIIEDLELLNVNSINSTDRDERKGLLETIIQPKSKIAQERLNKLSEYYTSNKNFLKDTQKILGGWEVDENIEWKVQATLENEDFHTFVRAASAIQGNEIVTLAATRDTIDTPIIKFVFGERMEFSNKVEFYVNAKFGDDVREDNKIPFNSEMLREIFNANKTSDTCHLSFVDDGLLRLTFVAEEEGINTTYFVVRKADY